MNAKQISVVFKQLLIVLLLAGVAHGATWYVDRDAVEGGDGTSWASAFREIQPAVEAAGDAGGGDVWIAEGLYNTAGNPSTGTIVALREGVSLYGGFAGTESSLETRDIEAHPTVLDASTSREGEPGRHILRSTFPATLDGLIFESARLESVLFYQWSGTANVDHCTFRNYRGEWYFALHFDASIGNSGSGGSAVVTDSLFLNNGEVGMVATEADSVEVCSSHFWGNSVGMGQYRVKTCSVRECSFLYNHRGGALWCHVGYPAPLKPLLVEQCWFEGNTSALEGGAINFDSDEYCLEGGPPEITNCVILNNQSGGFEGGAVYASFDNTSRKQGTAKPKTSEMGCSSYEMGIYHCTFVGNTSTARSGGSAIGGAYCFGYHCVFQGNSEPEIPSFVGVPWYSVFQSDHTDTLYNPEKQIPGTPGMLDPEHGNMRLKPGSPGTNLVHRECPVTTDYDGVDRDANGSHDVGAFEVRIFQDQDSNGKVELKELMRMVQFYNSDGYHCDTATEDSFAPGPGDTLCAPHTGDYLPADWTIEINELLRVIQFYNVGGFHVCPSSGTEDGLCPGGAVN